LCYIDKYAAIDNGRFFCSFIGGQNSQVQMGRWSQFGSLALDTFQVKLFVYLISAAWKKHLEID
jgi:hypothetical protein